MKKICFFDIYLKYNSKIQYGAQKSMEQLYNVLNYEYECKKLYLSSEICLNNVIKCNEILLLEGGKALTFTIKSKIKYIFYYIILQIKLIKYFIKERVEIVYTNDPRSFFTLYLATRILNLKTVIYIRYDLSKHWLNDFAIKKSNKVITIADGLLNNISSNVLKKNNNKIVTIYTGFPFVNVNDKIFVKKEKIRVGYVASITPRKGLLEFVKVLKTIKVKSKIELIIVGNVLNENEEYFKKIMKELVDNDIQYRYLGFQKEMDLIYKNIDILALYSFSEGLPRVIIEAMFYEIPVIANDIGGVNQIIENNKNGFLVKNSKQLKDSLEILVSDEQKIQEMGKEARRLVSEKFSLNIFEKKVYKVFKELEI